MKRVKLRRTVNAKVENFSCYLIGHWGSISFRMILKNSYDIIVDIKDIDIVSNILYKIFDIDPENGVMLSDISGKYCRVILTDCNDVIAIQHIIDDDRIIYLTNSDYKGD